MSKFIVATTGYDVSADERNLSINSDKSNMMIVDEVDIAGTDTQYTHGLGYLPTTLEFIKYSTQWFPSGSAIYNTSDTWVAVTGSYNEYDTNKIYFDNPYELDSKIFITGNAADNATGSGKITASGKVKVAKDGLNVPDITDIRQFQFCSGLDTIKKDLTLSGSTTLESDGTFTKTEITHNLGYHPVVIAKLSSNTYDSYYNNLPLPINMSIFSLVPVSFYTTTTKLVLFTKGVIGDFTISYNIYRNKIN